MLWTGLERCQDSKTCPDILDLNDHCLFPRMRDVEVATEHTSARRDQAGKMKAWDGLEQS